MIIIRSNLKVHAILILRARADDKAALDLIDAYLSQGSSSVLFQEVREKRGLLYDIDSGNYCLNDAGLFRIFAGVSESNAEQVLETILKELEKIKSGIEPEKLTETKSKLIGSLILDFESTKERCEQLGNSTIMSGKPKTIQEKIKDIESVTLEQVKQVAENFFDKNKLSITAIGLTRRQFSDLKKIIKQS